MLSKNIIQNHKKFNESIENIISYGLDIINDNLSYIKGRKSKKEKTMLIEALLLRSCVLWQSFVENEIIFLVNMESSKLKDEMRIPQNTKLNLTLIKALIFSNTYRNFSNIEQAMGEIKKIIIKEYNLFQKITKEQKNKIDFVYKIRNYLSHYSAFAKRQLFTVYEKAYSYQKFQEPGFFLMTKKGKNFEVLIHNFKMVSKLMEKK